jgi:hypothetical protein
MRVSFIDMTMDFHKICRSGNLKGEFQKTVTCELLSRVFLPPLTSFSRIRNTGMDRKHISNTTIQTIRRNRERKKRVSEQKT